LFSALLAGCGKTDQSADAANSIPTARVQAHDIADTIELTGEVVPLTLWEIKSEISGRVIAVHAQPGDMVTEGQVLVELDRTKLASDAQEAERLVEAADISSQQALRDLHRTEDLFKSGVSMQKDLLDAQVTRDLALNNLAVQRARLVSSRELLIQAVIKAPHAGMVLQHTLREGQVIVGANSFSQGTVLMPVADVSQLLVETNVNEIDSPRIKRGMPAQISFDTIRDQVFPGIIETVAPSATLVDQIRVFPVRIRFAGDPPPVKPGISANVTLTVEEVHGVPSVPLAAVFADGPRHFVFRRDAAGFTRVTVAIGVNNLERVEIRSGLKLNDVVALARPTASTGE
jgi:HlyD family secretion protein